VKQMKLIRIYHCVFQYSYSTERANQQIQKEQIVASSSNLKHLLIT